MHITQDQYLCHCCICRKKIKHQKLSDFQKDLLRCFGSKTKDNVF